MKNGKKIRIGGASGFWGDASLSTAQLLRSGRLDYLVYDYLAEITMSILARARAKDSTLGYATDFVSATLAPNLAEIARQGVKVISNAGGVNPHGCAEAVRTLLQELGLNLTVAVVSGDDLLGLKESFAKRHVSEMFSGEPFPPVDKIASINAYLGAFPIAKALDLGADIVITGRCVDSAVTLGACIHEFGWGRQAYDQLAQGSLAGHLLECGTQLTGGNHTDWELVVDTLADVGYPIVEINESGEFVCSKPVDTGGRVTVGTCAEQLLYEIGDPQRYILPDVVCDFSQVTLTRYEENQVLVQGARGRPAPDSYKGSVTFADGYRGDIVFTIYGGDAEKKAGKFVQIVRSRASSRLALLELPDFGETLVEVIGAESHYGANRLSPPAREVNLKIAVMHPLAEGVNVLFKEAIGAALAAPPGVTNFLKRRPRPSPVVRLFSMEVPRHELEIVVTLDGQTVSCNDPIASASAIIEIKPPALPTVESPTDGWIEMPLIQLAWARSGDKGNLANIGVIARQKEYLPYIAHDLSCAKVAACFAHFLEGPVERFYLPGCHAINYVLHDVLGGGGIASLRTDSQGKGYAQMLLEQTIRVPLQFSLRT